MTTAVLSQAMSALGRVSVQAAVLVLLVLVLQRGLRRWLTPRWRSALWLLVLARLWLPASVPTRISLFNLLPASVPETRLVPAELAAGEGRPVEASPATLTASRRDQIDQRDQRDQSVQARTPAATVVPAPFRESTVHSPRPRPVPWTLWLGGVWMAGVGALGMLLVVTSTRLARRLRGTPEIAEPAVLAMLDSCRTQMQVRTRLRLVESAAVRSPALHGVFRPRLLLPIGFTNALPPDELRFVFLHELAHLKRRDVLVNWLVALVQVVHWFNPLIWFGFARWRADREMACDALVLERMGEDRKQDYGRTILRLLEGFTQRAMGPGLVGILEDKRQLRQRMAMIASFTPAKRISALAVLILPALALIGLTDAQLPRPPGPAAAPARESIGAPAGAAPAADAPSPKATVLTRLQIVEKETSRPLAGVKLAIGYFFAGGRMERRETSTDEAGTVVIEDYAGSRGMNVFVVSQGFVPKVINWSLREEIPPAYTLRLARAARVAGVVRNESGQPVAGVKLNLQRPGIDDDTEREHIDFHPRLTAVVTDEEGRWAFHWVPKEFESVGINLDHPEYAVTLHRVPVGKPESTNAVLILERGVTVQGRVTGPEEEPVGGAEVREVHNFGYDARSTRTKPDGSYSLIGLRPGAMRLVVQTDRLAPGLKTLEATGALARADFRLARGTVFRGRVRDREGKPIAGAIAMTDSDNQGLRKVEWSTRTDAAGRFEWTAAPDEALLFWFEAEGFGWKRGVLLQPGDGEHEIVLDKAETQSPHIRISGRVVDAATQQPLPSFKVSVGELSTADFPPRYRPGARGEQGQFRLTIDTACPFPSYLLLVEAEGYLPVKSPPQSIAEGNKALNFELRQGAGVAGTMRLANGRPAAGAMVYYCTLQEGVYMEKPGEVRREVTRAAQARADEHGGFVWPTNPDAHSIIAIHDDGFAEVNVVARQQSNDVVLLPWGRVEGQLLRGSSPAAGETINVSTVAYRYGDGVRSFAPLSLWLSAQTDAEGRFVIEKVPPGERKIDHRLSVRQGKPGPIPLTQGFSFHVKPGETTRVTVGGTGRPVTGRVVVEGYDEPIDWDRDVHWIRIKQAEPIEAFRPRQDDFSDMTEFMKALKEFSAKHKAFWISEEGRALERAVRSYVPVFAPDGSFRAEDVPAGTYEMVIKPTPTRDDDSVGPSRWNNGKEIGVLTNLFTIPAMPGGRSDSPYDLGVLTLVAAKTLKVGQAAPRFDLAALDGQLLRLADYRGKFVLLDFWATWCGPCVAEMPQVKAAYGVFQDDPRFVMIGLSLDRDRKALEQFLAKNDLPWPQALLGEAGKTVLKDYAVEGIPAMILIGPDGKVLAKNLRGASVQGAVAKALRGN